MPHDITRRRALKYAGAAGLAASGGGLIPKMLARPSVAQAASGCATLTPDLEEGPYFVDLDLHRSDVTANTSDASVDPGVAQDGVPLTLTINVTDATNDCEPYNNAYVDVWLANAYGLYSDESTQDSGDSSTDQDTTGQNYLRGYQVTGVDAATGGVAVDGQVVFEMIWPGWYSGRAIHIHVRLRAYDSSGSTITDYTTRIYFSDSDNDYVLENAAPYDTRATVEDPTTDENDPVLTSSEFATNVVSVTGSLADGYAATFDIILDEGVQDSSNGGGTGGPGSGTPTTTTTAATTTATAATTTTATTTGTSTTSDTSSLHCSVSRVRVTRGSHHTRRLDAKVTTDERVTVNAAVMRHGKRIAGTHGHIPKGTHEMKITIPHRVAAGTATLVLKLTDARGQQTVRHRHVHIPSR